MNLKAKEQAQIALKEKILVFLNQYQQKMGMDDDEISAILGHNRNVIRRVRVEENYYGSEQLFAALKILAEVIFRREAQAGNFQQNENLRLAEEINSAKTVETAAQEIASYAADRAKRRKRNPESPLP